MSIFATKYYTMQNEINTIEAVQELIKEEMALLVYYYNDDCAPCISLRPKVEELIENDFPLMKLVFVNSKNFPMIPANYGVFSNPTLLLYFDGKESKRYSKYISIVELSQVIGRYYQMIYE